MRNDTQLKVTYITNENRKDEYHFDYYNKEGKMVGTVSVDEVGRLKWFVWDEKYQSNILYTASYIYGMEIGDATEFVEEAELLDPLRWERAEEFVESKGLFVNYPQKNEFSRGFSNRSRR